MDCVGHILHPRILQHRVCMAWRDLLPHSAADGNIRRRQRLLQQLLRPWSTLPPDWQHPEVVAQESGSTMAFVEVVPKRISRVLHVLFHSNDYPHRECGKRRELAARNHTPALDFDVPWHWAYPTAVEPWVAQFAFGLYGIMLTSLIVGVILTVVYRPRTWCVFCPMGNMTQIICKLKHKSVIRP